MENPIKMDDLRGTPIFGKPQIFLWFVPDEAFSIFIFFGVFWEGSPVLRPSKNLENAKHGSFLEMKQLATDKLEDA